MQARAQAGLQGRLARQPEVLECCMQADSQCTDWHKKKKAASGNETRRPSLPSNRAVTKKLGFTARLMGDYKRVKEQNSLFWEDKRLSLSQSQLQSQSTSPPQPHNFPQLQTPSAWGRRPDYLQTQRSSRQQQQQPRLHPSPLESFLLPMSAPVGPDLAMTIGAAAMPTCCFLTAWRKHPFRHLFFIPVGGVSLGIIFTLIGWPSD